MEVLSKAMVANAAANGRHGAMGAKRFVSSDAVLADVDWDGDAALKHRRAPVFMEVLAAAVQSKSWYYEKRLMENCMLWRRRRWRRGGRRS